MQTAEAKENGPMMIPQTVIFPAIAHQSCCLDGWFFCTHGRNHFYITMSSPRVPSGFPCTQYKTCMGGKHSIRWGSILRGWKSLDYQTALFGQVLISGFTLLYLSHCYSESLLHSHTFFWHDLLPSCGPIFSSTSLCIIPPKEADF